MMGYVNGADGKRRKLHVLIVTLPMSRYQFVWSTFLQTTEALVDGLDAASRFFGGVTHRVVLDNTSAAIVRASAQDPTINPSFAEYALLALVRRSSPPPLDTLQSRDHHHQ